MSYRTAYLPEADRALLSLPRAVRRSVRRLVEALADTPRPTWADYMWGEWEGYWRFHVGPGAYRVIYTIDDRASALAGCTSGSPGKGLPPATTVTLMLVPVGSDVVFLLGCRS